MELGCSRRFTEGPEHLDENLDKSLALHLPLRNLPMIALGGRGLSNFIRILIATTGGQAYSKK